MNKDTQKPILFKADPLVYAQMDVLKEKSKYKFNRNRFLNDAALLFIELVKLTQQPEYAYLNEVSFNDAHLQKILYQRLKRIVLDYPAR